MFTNTVKNDTLPIGSPELKHLSDGLGWIYTIAWMLCFYPQIWENWKRKSVTGYSFDFFALDTTDLTVYSVYNLALYAITSIKEEYKREEHTNVIPVKINDLVFSTNGVVCCIIMLIQAFIYERGGQKVSKICKGVTLLIFLYIFSTMIPTLTGALNLVDFFEYISYVKIATTLKYMPQVWMNYQRGSTQGFSIGMVALDITGGSLSVGQMLVNCYNKDDWSSLEGNATKLLVGIMSVLFDVILMAQHLFYKHNIPLKSLQNNNDKENNEEV